jgi:hypothetical protein
MITDDDVIFDACVQDGFGRNAASELQVHRGCAIASAAGLRNNDAAVDVHEDDHR